VHGTQESGNDAGARAGGGDEMAEALGRAGDLGAAAEVVLGAMRPSRQRAA
jgi:hypothetical protein